MTGQVDNSLDTPAVQTLLTRLDALALSYARIDAQGKVVVHSDISAFHSDSFIKEIAQWSDRPTKAGELFEIFDGLWLSTIFPAGVSPAETNGNIVGIFPGDAFFEGEDFEDFCAERGFDPATERQSIVPDQRISKEQAAQYTKLLTWISEDRSQLAQSEIEIGGVAQELADSYEELNLLYKLSCSMTLNTPRIGFLSETCMELQQVLGLEWLAIHLSADETGLSDLRGKTFTAGGPRGDRDAIPDLGRALIEHQPFSDQPHVIDHVAELHIPGVEAVADNLLVVPLQIERKRLGVLYGGNKLDGTTITSIDAKLCSSLANGVTIYLQNSALYEDMESMFMGTLKALTSAIDAKDSYTFGHTERVAMMSRQLAKASGIDDADVERIYLSGLLHDVGKIGVPESVLTKPGALTDDEFGLIKMHPEIGARILGDIRQMRDLIPGVLYHHERWDGKGYPAGLSGDDIPLFGRVICVADSFDAMSSNRTYRQAMPHSKVMSQIRECAGTQFDPQLAQVFLGLDFAPYLEMADRHRSQSTKRCA